jgi:hypothetical protein
MKIEYGKGTTEYGPGVDIFLTGCDVAMAISAYLVAHDIHVVGPRTITVNKELCDCGKVYVDPSGFVIHNEKKTDGRGAAKLRKQAIQRLTNKAQKPGKHSK